jgi:ABC-type Zn uptake system ZnuABC Zn-binding protein ZnuA
MEHHKEIVEYFQRKGVSAIFLLRRNFLRRVVSVLANSYDKYAKPLNGTHKSHVHSTTEVSSCPLFLYHYIYMYNNVSYFISLNKDV